MRRSSQLLLVLLVGCTSAPVEPPAPRALPSPSLLSEHCAEVVGEPRVLEVAEGVWAAVGYDLANTILVQTADGNVVIDAGMSPSRSAVSRAALLEKAPGPTAAIVYTHSHIDHVGGASVWMEEATQVWATERFEDHFFKQYGVFLGAENARGARQFGRDVPLEQLPCSGLGRKVDIPAALDVGAVLPTHTFSGEHQLSIGGVTLTLVEAHGETDDQLFVWHEAQGVLMPGDNWYRAFPNLYTVRGARPRPVDTWIESLDAMRRRGARILLPSHTVPVVGEEQVETALRTYRDGIQWVRDSVVRSANAGRSVDMIAAEVRLPPHLAEVPALAELYGQIDWSVRAIYANELGWFDSKAHRLYPTPPAERAAKMVALMGGSPAVIEAAAQAAAKGEHAWALELLALVGDAAEEGAPDLSEATAQSLEALATQLANTNGRGYLLQSAIERRAGAVERQGKPTLSDAFVRSIPLTQIFEIMASKLRPAEVMDRHDSVVFEFSDVSDRFVVTIRRGIAEVVRGESLPGTPAPLATVRTDARTWRRLALGIETGKDAIADGRMEVEGSKLGLLGFMNRFDRGFGAGGPLELP
ncbi:MAG: MBL fold metallo-hydrolase [Deltaproteobacteria bacterium]|nr:MBL fold metallo-hydrolase [Deltaproteobacteria bacterium]